MPLAKECGQSAVNDAERARQRREKPHGSVSVVDVPAVDHDHPIIDVDVAATRCSDKLRVRACIEKVDGSRRLTKAHKPYVARAEGALAIVQDVNAVLILQLIERIYHAITQSLHGV